jgi:hypothetical protein
MNKDYILKEALHTAFALAVTVAVSVAAAVVAADAISFTNAFLVGLAITGLRSLCTAIVVLGAKHVIK